jgi:hypothetical protein
MPHIRTASGILIPSEAKTLDVASKYQPWKISMYVIDKAPSDKPRLVTYFIRCPDPTQAATLAERLWHRWEKAEKGMAAFAFPDVRGKAHAVALDEGDWKDYLKTAIRLGRKQGLQICLAGDATNPNAWTVPGLTFADEQMPQEKPMQGDFLDDDLRGGVRSGRNEKRE